MNPIDIQRKLKADYGIDVPLPTLSTWYNEANMEKSRKIAPDRCKVSDVRYNPKQRPDVLVDMENILARKVIAIKLTGVPYTGDVVKLLAIHIFHKLISYNIDDRQGKFFFQKLN